MIVLEIIGYFADAPDTLEYVGMATVVNGLRRAISGLAQRERGYYEMSKCRLERQPQCIQSIETEMLTRRSRYIDTTFTFSLIPTDRIPSHRAL